MKVFLFAYPDREYVGSCLGGLTPEELDWEDPCWHDKVITARYREQDFKVFWLMFSQPNNPSLPDLLRLSRIVRLHPNDRVISAGISFNQMTGGRYPKLAFIEAQLPVGIEHLVIGGFHIWDCVDRLARYFYQRIPSVRVDEDLTEFFFGRMRTRGIPLIRAGSDSGLARLEGWMRDHARRMRRKHPWLVQIPKP